MEYKEMKEYLSEVETEQFPSFNWDGNAQINQILGDRSFCS